MASFSVPNVRISGVAAAVPTKIESNWDYDLLSQSEKKLLIKTTGVEERRIAPKGLTTSDLCFKAAQQLLKEMRWKNEEVELLIFLSQSRDYCLPATAVILQHRLGLSDHCMAFDVGLGCSGFVYGLSIIGSLMAATGLKKGLLMMGDISSASCAYEDKSTYPLFGDAGTVTAIEYDANAQPMHFDLKNDGSRFESIIIPDGGIRNFVSASSFEKKEYAEGIKRSALNLSLNGLDVFNFSITEVPKAIKKMYASQGTTADSYDYFLMHQANKLMNETIRKKVGFEKIQTPYSIRCYGNTSSASIPLTIVSELREEVTSRALQFLITGFGVGLSWGVGSIAMNNIVCPKLIEV